MGRVYAALDRLSGRQVALKQVALPQPPEPQAAGPVSADTLPAVYAPAAATTLKAGQRPAASSSDRPDSDGLRLRLAHEFRTLATMRHPHIVSVLDYGFDEQRQPFYTMELLLDAAPLLRTGDNWALDTQLELIAQLLRALCYLHRRGVLHRDLKPANLLVLPGPSGPTLKVLDFGLALAREQAGRAAGEISGTLGYLAPEVLLGAEPSEAADLYAAGVIAYQLLTGRSAFGSPDEDALLSDMLAGQVDLTPLRPLGEIGDFVACLLAQAPEERFPSASDALSALALASGRPLLDEDSALRDSFLHTARFVGRERENALLREALAGTVRGRGAVWLIGGQSGIGKTRLLDELRTLALVQGVLTVRGQSVSSAGRPYRVFEDALRLLCLHVELTEMEAAVVAVLFPELAALSGRPLAELPSLDAQGAQQRVMRVAAAMMSRLGRPLLLLLEDLQWADPESIALLAQLARVAPRQAALIVGTYRDDEAARLPAAVPGAQVLKLSRLSPPNVAALSASILGPTGVRAELLTLLERETEGNAFFLVEVLRSLAEQAGGLSAVGSGPVPEQVFAGGVHAVLERRLNAVPQWARLGLRRCAVRGRRLELSVLPRFVAAPERFLQVCAEAGVIEAVEDAWHFSHDKLRERVLESLEPAEAACLHRDVAAALTSAYPDMSQHSAAIAEHYELAGDIGLAAPHWVRAASLALDQGALEAAIRCSQAALAAPSGSLSAMQTAQAHKALVGALFGLRRMDECVATFERTLQPPAGPRAWPQATAAAAQELIGRIRPVGRWVVRRALRRQAPAPERLLARERFLTALIAAEAYVVRGDQQKVPLVALRNLALAEVADDAGLRAMGSAGVSYIVENLGLHRLSDFLLKRSKRYLRGLRDPRAEIEYLRMRGLLLVGRGELVRGEQSLLHAQQRAEELGSEELRLLMMVLLTLSASLHGDCRRLSEQAQALERAATPSQHPQYLLVGRLYRALGALREGDLDTTEAMLAATEALLPCSEISLLFFSCLAYRAQLALRRSEQAAALRYVEQALPMLSRLPMYTPANLHYIGTLIDACLQLAEHSESPAERIWLLAGTERGLILLRNLVGRHPVAAARYFLYKGQLARLRGRPGRAHRLVQRACILAAQQALPFEQALALRALGQLEQSFADPVIALGARRHLSRAALLFEQLGARAEQAIAQKLLAADAPPLAPDLAFHAGSDRLAPHPSLL